jgi:hypothetical protein
LLVSWFQNFLYVSYMFLDGGLRLIKPLLACPAMNCVNILIYNIYMLCIVIKYYVVYVLLEVIARNISTNLASFLIIMIIRKWSLTCYADIFVEIIKLLYCISIIDKLTFNIWVSNSAIALFRFYVEKTHYIRLL